jgi:hypothetical protein
VRRPKNAFICRTKYISAACYNKNISAIAVYTVDYITYSARKTKPLALK